MKWNRKDTEEIILAIGVVVGVLLLNEIGRYRYNKKNKTIE